MEIWARLLVVQEWAGSLIILTSTALLTYLYWLQKCWNAQCLLCLQEQQWTLPHPNTDTACLLMYKTCKTMKTMMLFSGNFHTMFMWYRGVFFFRPVTSSLSSSSSKIFKDTLLTMARCAKFLIKSSLKITLLMQTKQNNNSFMPVKLCCVWHFLLIQDKKLKRFVFATGC